MVLDRADAPQVHVVRGLDDLRRTVDRRVVDVAVAADGAQRGALGLVLRRQHRIDDGHGLQVWH